MSRYPTIDFIHLCDVPKGKERLKALAEDTGFNVEIIEPYEKDIERILDFIQKVDNKYHEMAEKISFFEDNSFFAGTFHGHIASDLRSIILLSLSKQEYQANIILRHFIETFIWSLWADITSRFQGCFNYFLETKEWKPYRSTQQVTWEMEKYQLPNRSIKERLERIRLINFIDLKGKNFYKEYFSKASECDLILLLSLPICEGCMKKNKGKVKFEEFDLDPKIRKKGLEDKHAVYKTDFGFVCSFCGYQRLTHGYVRGIPEVPTMADMLVAIIDDTYVNDIRILQKCFNHLSEEYVHFSPTIHPDRKPKKTNIGGRKVFLYGLNGVVYCIEFLDHLMEHYFELLKNCNEVERKPRRSHQGRIMRTAPLP